MSKGPLIGDGKGGLECYSDHLRIIENSISSDFLVLRSWQILVGNHLYLSFLQTDSLQGTVPPTFICHNGAEQVLSNNFRLILRM
jgi:hypothetical protein